MPNTRVANGTIFICHDVLHTTERLRKLGIDIPHYGGDVAIIMFRDVPVKLVAMIDVLGETDFPNIKILYQHTLPQNS